MTRSQPRRPPPPRAPQPAAFALNGTAVCAASEARGWTIAALALVAALFIASVLAIAGPHRVGDYFTESDFYGAYARGARLIQHGQLVPSRYTVVGPGYEIALAVAGFAIRDLFRAAQLLSALSVAGIAWAWFVLLRRRVDARLGAAMLLFLCSNDGLFRYASSATTDAFGIALQAAALFALLGAPRAEPGVPAAPGARRFAVAGLLAAFAFLTRYNAVALLPAGLLAILAGGTGTPRRGTAAIAFTAAFLVPVLPWIAFSLAHGGTLGTQLHHNIAYEVFARSKGIAWDDYQKDLQSQFPNLGAVIARDPGAVARQMFANVFDHLRGDAANVLGWPAAIAAIAGLVFALRTGWRHALWPLLAAGALLFLTLVPVFYSERYSLALLPVYATLAGAAFASPLLALAAGRGPRVWLKTLGAPLLVALALPAGLARQARTFEQLPYEVLDAGKALHGLRAHGDRVISRKAHIAYYGDCEPLAFPFAGDLDGLARYARETHARWLYVSWPEVETRPGFYHLLDTAGVVPGLTARYSSPVRPAVLYEIGPGFGAAPAWAANDTLRALHTLRGRTRVDTSDPKLFKRLGVVAWMLDHLPEARLALERSLAINPNDAEASSYLGRVTVGLGDYASARTAYGNAMQLAPGDPDPRAGFGLAAFLMGRDREAADAWRPVIPYTTEPRILRAMAQLYDSLGDAESATAARARLSGSPLRYTP
jgi:hypothetical protein